MYTEPFYANWQIQILITMEKNIVMKMIVFISDVMSFCYISIIFQKTLKKKAQCIKLLQLNISTHCVSSLETFSVVSKMIRNIKKKYPSQYRFNTLRYKY
jgi:hypothetical protein